ncbi:MULTISPECIES: ATP-dependent DNA helicase [Bacteroidales]|nr:MULTISPECIES: ATP-dependent RecD-like DNA helicase [Bacteroidales]MCB7369155.1 ATP-dependent RecD-like DNA helicase [Bacteroides caccae]MCZ2727018.1 ATP-dependent RecD-like DNA helicase [Bacteroides caccae]
MNQHSYKREFKHVYAGKGGRHDVLKPTTIEIPAYSALAIPFRYMSLDSQSWLSDRHPEFHDVEKSPFNSSWLYGAERQLDILKWFRGNIEANESICVFYCKNGNPVDDEGRRMIVGMGEVTSVASIKLYDTEADYTYPLWEMVVQHSIRQELQDSKGFLLPYNQYLEFDEDYIQKKTGLTKEEALDEIKISLDKLGNTERIFNELSYGCEFISNQSMLIILENARRALEAVMKHGLVGGDWQLQLRWINDSIAKVKSSISPFPSFAECLKAIGVNYSYLIERDILTAGCGKKDNPWRYYNDLMAGKLPVPNTVYFSELPAYKKSWEYRSDEGKRVLELLSRFELDADIIGQYANNAETYEKLLTNPYIISEKCAQDYDNRVNTQTIDFGVIPDVDIQGENIPTAPFAVRTLIDERRLRSMTVERLCSALDDGDTLLSIAELEQYVSDTLSDTNSLLPNDYFLTVRGFFSDELVYLPDDNPKALQLKEYAEMERWLSKRLLARAKSSVRNKLNVDWETRAMSSSHYDKNNENSREATRQQIEALEMMTDRKLSVLTGGAGTGKTTVVETFLSCSQIKNEGVLLLAPTGKARVRLGKMGKGVEAQTIAQFLVRQGFFDWDRMLAIDNPNGRQYANAANVIIDECSMLTTRDLYILLKALDLAKINRLILIGDPCQLPPIGAGRPFADLCYRLQNKDTVPVLNSAITSLETVVRTITTGESDILTLASWFSSKKPKKGADEIFNKMATGDLNGDLQVMTWTDESDLEKCLMEALCIELGCTEDNLSAVLQHRLGIDSIKSLAANPNTIESVQVLTPVLNPIWGSLHLNECVQKWIGTYDKEFIQFSTQKIYPKDKIMQLKNEKVEAYPSHQKYQLSNGQIGFVRSIYKGYANLIYAGIPNESFGKRGVSGEDSETPIELAYSITIHKSQGSDFNTVVLVLPKFGRILTRELIYTALTRAKKKLILLIQDNVYWLWEKTKPQASILAQRNSNMFEQLVARENKSSIPYVEGLIHRTKNPNLMVRSKSEVIIANELISADIKFKYEEMFNRDGHQCLPDFTFVDLSDEIIIWEHLGMLTVPEYKTSWEKKLKFYNSIGFIEGENLFTTHDHENGSIDTTEIMKVIDKIKNLVE